MGLNETRERPDLDRVSKAERNGERARSVHQVPSNEATQECSAEHALLDPQERLAALEPGMAQLIDLQKSILAALKQQDIQQQVLANIHDECQELRERHYEREIFEPLMRGLILIADRVRQENEKLRRTLKTHNGALANALVCQHVIDARKADLVEVEALLAQYGVERFRNNDETFDRRTQTCVQRVPTPDSHRYGRVAQRLLPGYRRGETVVCRERVNIYVALTTS